MAIEINIEDIGIDEIEVTEILVKVGDKVKKDQPLITIEGDKVSMEVPSPFSGIIKEIKVKIGDKISNGALIMLLDKEDNDSINLNNGQIEETPCVGNEMIQEIKHDYVNNTYIHATPLIRRLAREFSINLAKVKATGRKGRILREDVYNYIKRAINYMESMSDNTINDIDFTQKRIKSSFFESDSHKFGEVIKIKLSRIQKVSGDNLKRNWITIPHVTHFDKTDVTDLEEFRKIQNIEAEKNKLEIKITPVVFIMKAVAIALELMPNFNSSLSDDGYHLILKKYINIGVAVDTPNGLVVPVFKNVNKKGIIELSRELMNTSKRARDGKLTAKEMQGVCFTISSIGKLGTTHFTPIVNFPEVAILGISKFSIEPVWNGKKFMPRLMLPISLSFDHRVINGADGARFITIINNTLNDIRRLIM